MFTLSYFSQLMLHMYLCVKIFIDVPHVSFEAFESIFLLNLEVNLRPISHIDIDLCQASIKQETIHTQIMVW